MIASESGEELVTYRSDPTLDSGDSIIFKLPKTRKVDDGSFLHPSKIHKYHCQQCDTDYSGSPKVEVSVKVLSEDETGVLTGIYQCFICSCNNYLAVFTLQTVEESARSFITRDESGEYKKPNQGDISYYLDKCTEEAEKGVGKSINDKPYAENLATARRFSRKLGIRTYPGIEDMLEVAYKNAYIERVTKKLPELVSEILELGYGFSLEPHDDINSFEGTGLQDKFNRLYEIVPHLIIPEDDEMHKNILRILQEYRRMHEEQVELRTKEKETLEQRITGHQEEIEKTDKDIASFIQSSKRSSDVDVEIEKSEL